MDVDGCMQASMGGGGMNRRTNVCMVGWLIHWLIRWLVS